MRLTDESDEGQLGGIEVASTAGVVGDLNEVRRLLQFDDGAVAAVKRQANVPAVTGKKKYEIQI